MRLRNCPAACKRRLAVFSTLFALLFGVVPASVAYAATVASGTAINDPSASSTVTWTLDDSGVLTLSGGTWCPTGNESWPWTTYASQITSIDITAPITSSCPPSMELPALFVGLGNVTSITGLSNIDMSDVGDCRFMFSGMTSLTSLDLSSFDGDCGGNQYAMLDGLESLTSITFGPNFTIENPTPFASASPGLLGTWQNAAGQTYTSWELQQLPSADLTGTWTRVPDVTVPQNVTDDSSLVAAGQTMLDNYVAWGFDTETDPYTVNSASFDPTTGNFTLNTTGGTLVFNTTESALSTAPGNLDVTTPGTYSMNVSIGGGQNFPFTVVVTPVTNPVTFDPNGGTFPSGTTGTTADRNLAQSLAGTPLPATAPTRAGFTFTGWYTDAAATQPLSAATGNVTAPVTVYAGWAADAVVEPTPPPPTTPIPSPAPTSPPATPVPPPAPSATSDPTVEPVVATGVGRQLHASGVPAAPLLLSLALLFLTS